MASESLRQGPLDHLGIAARSSASINDAAVVLAERPFRDVIDLRGQLNGPFGTAVADVLGIALPDRSPLSNSAEGISALWMGPDRWWIVSTTGQSPSDRLRERLAPLGSGITEIGDSLAIVALSGRHARDVLAKGCTLDLHPRAFRPGDVAQTLLAKAQITLNQIAASEYEIYVRRSFAEYLWTWLEDAAAEYGVAVGAA